MESGDEIIKGEEIVSFSLSWTLNGVGGRCNNPIWCDIEARLKALRNGYGALTLDIHGNDEGPQVLQLRAEAGNYLLMLGEIVDEDYEVRTYLDEENTGEKVIILGDYWPKNQITTDFSFVIIVINEFFDTGNVQRNLLI